MLFTDEDLGLGVGSPTDKTYGDGLYRFMWSYIGSKKKWVSRLAPVLSGRHIVEPFCGSAVLTANHARSAVINDVDPMIHRIISRFDEQIVPEVFTTEDYYRVRGREDWWRYAFCLQSMSFSSLFRYSRNGFNAAPKGEEVPEVRLRSTYERSLERWHQLSPVVLNGDWSVVPVEDGSVVVLDPPYQGTKAKYNELPFDYDQYWDRVREWSSAGVELVVFDTVANLEAAGLEVLGQRKTRLNGSRPGGTEGIALVNINPNLVPELGGNTTAATSESPTLSQPALDLGGLFDL